MCMYVQYIGAGRDVWSGLGVTMLVGLVYIYRPKFMSEQYFLLRKLGLGKEVVSLSLAVTEVSRGGGMR